MRFLPPFLALAAGGALSFAYPRWNVSWMVWLWMLPLLYALWAPAPSKVRDLKAAASEPAPQKRGAWSGFGLAYLAGLGFFISNLHWVRHSARVVNGARDESWVGWGLELTGMGSVIGLAAYLSLYWGLWGAFAATLGRPRISPDGRPNEGDSGALFSVSLESLRSAFLCAAAWVACEWLRGIVFTGFGWNGLGVALWTNKSLIQSAEFVGVTGLSFLPVFVSCILWNTVLRFRQEVRTSRVRPHADFFCAVLLMLLNFGFGAKRLLESTTPGPRLNLVLVQLNLAQRDKWAAQNDMESSLKIYGDYRDLTRLALAMKPDSPPDLIVWPESALSFDFFDPNHVPILDKVLASGPFSLLTGTDIFQPEEAKMGEPTPSYTGAALMRGSFENHQLYRKVHLVPFGEYLPGRSFAPVNMLLGHLVPGDFESGHVTEPLLLEKPEGIQIIPLICFEDTVGRLARKFVRDAPQLMVNMTNDGWFFHSEANEQHLANAVFRCVELRRPMVRACNTGITCELDDCGRVPRGGILLDARGSPFTKGVLPREIVLPKAQVMTFYASYGDAFSILMLVTSAGAILQFVIKITRRKTPSPSAPTPLTPNS